MAGDYRRGTRYNFNGMLNTLKIAVTLLVLTLPAAARAQLPGTNDPDYKELVAYRLTIPTLNKVVQATKTLAESARKDPRFQKMQALGAEIKKLEAKEERSEADETRLEQLKEELEKSQQSVMTSEDTKTLSQMAAAINREPLFKNALASAGLDAREYAKFSLAYFQAAMVAGMMKSGMIKEVPKEMAAAVNMENVKFVQEHEAEMAAFAKAMEALRSPE